MPDPSRSSTAPSTDQPADLPLVEAALLADIEFESPERAQHALRSILHGAPATDRKAFFQFLTLFFQKVAQAADPDLCLTQLEQLMQVSRDRGRLVRYLAEHPRAIEILLRIFRSSRYLTQILFRHPDALFRLSVRESLAEFKSREQFRDEALTAAGEADAWDAKLNALRRYQREELLRIGTCDAFGLMDLKSITVQLSLLADGLVQSCLQLILDAQGWSGDGFVVLACGKLGGEELNYSSDIDLLFLADDDPASRWPLGQKLIQALSNATAEGFLYRVDLRLRPWGDSGPLVNSVDAHLDYLRRDAQHWERQSLIKARVIAGDRRVGAAFLKQVDRLVYSGAEDELRGHILEMKQGIERELKGRGSEWGEVKSGAGSIRDVEFVTQYLQIRHGSARPELRTFNTLDGLIRLAEFGFLRSDEYRQLSTGYLFLRTVEHSLQLMHNKQLHRLPESRPELDALARRLDFPSGEMLVQQYDNHRRAIRRIFDAHLSPERDDPNLSADRAPDRLLHRLSLSEPAYVEVFPPDEREQHRALLFSLGKQRPIAVSATDRDGGRRWQITVVGHDVQGVLSIICGLLFGEHFDVVEGLVFTDDEFLTVLDELRDSDHPPLFLNFFTVERDATADPVDKAFWKDYERRLTVLVRQLNSNDARKAQAAVARLASLRVSGSRRPSVVGLQPVRFEIDNQFSPQTTILHIQSEDTPGFLYELTNALTLARVNIVRMLIGSEDRLVRDTLFITDSQGRKIVDETRLRELTTTVLLVKHCMHLLPSSADPEGTWLHLREFLEQLFQQPDWYEQMGQLDAPTLPETLTRILGVSDYLWQDFLRLHHDSVLPFVQNVDQLARRRSRRQLERELTRALRGDDTDLCKTALNRIKDRETFRTDMRHLLGYLEGFAEFSDELTDICEATVDAAVRLAYRHLERKHGRPIDAETGEPCPLAVLALGKCGGRELGFASDIELMFLYDGRGKTDGPRTLRESFFFERLVKKVSDLIIARREGIFELDLRLRPYGSAGPLAVSLTAFRDYFGPGGPAWPFERQALVKLRPIGGDEKLGHRVAALRDDLLFRGEPFDVAAMRGMREKQILQHVEAGRINAKLSPGGLVDVEYLVQGLQIAHGDRVPELRDPNSLAAMTALHRGGLLRDREFDDLSAAYTFLRKLIDALRMVRGNARDLTVPLTDSEEFEFLARRLGFREQPLQLLQDFERHSARILEIMRDLEDRQAFSPSTSDNTP